jgi:hypothetical protein
VVERITQRRKREAPWTPAGAVHPGETLRLRATDEPVTLVAVLDAGGSLLLVRAPDAEFQVHRDDVMTDRERHGCACCA